MARIQIKSADKIADKWQQRAQGATEAYTQGVADPTVNWADAAAAAEGSYKDGVIAAAQRGAFKNGVTDAGNEAWRKGASGKGVARWAPGIGASKPAMVAGMAPVVETLSNLDLPPRRPARDPQNMQRVLIVAKALGDAKLERQRSGA